MKKIFFKNTLCAELMIPTRTGSMKIFKNDIIEGNAFQPLVEKGFLIPITEEEIEEKAIKYTYYTSAYLMSSK